MEWSEASKDCRFFSVTTGDIRKGAEAWPRMFDWYIQASLKLREIVDSLDK